ncbi:MAG: hypothetical protein ABR577_17360 [Pyrinomonadaceae bacterium]
MGDIIHSEITNQNRRFRKAATPERGFSKTSGAYNATESITSSRKILPASEKINIAGTLAQAEINLKSISENPFYLRVPYTSITRGKDFSLLTEKIFVARGMRLVLKGSFLVRSSGLTKEIS